MPCHELVEAFLEAVRARYLLRDRDRIYGDYFRQRARGLGLQEVLSAPHRPWQNAYVERLIGSIRRECLDHVIVLNNIICAASYKAVLGTTIVRGCTDLSTKTRLILGQVQLPTMGTIIEIGAVGSLHHRNERRAG